MYCATTDDITVTVSVQFAPERSKPDEGAYFWTYTIEIANGGSRVVQLTDRHWRITDERGQRQTVEGPGVVGVQPTLRPGQSFRYSSGCPLTTPSGFMVGSYRMVDQSGGAFDVAIPAFSLDSPYERKVMN